MNERKIKIPSDVKPVFNKGRVMFETRPRLFGWLWCPIPDFTTTYTIDYGSREIVKREWFGGIKQMPIDSLSDAPRSFMGWLFGRGNLILEKNSVKLELKAIKNPEDFLEFFKDLRDPNLTLPSLAELNIQRVTPFWAEFKFWIASAFYPSFISYARFMRPFDYYVKEMTVEQILHNSEEIVSFAESHPEKAEARLLLGWLNWYYLNYLYCLLNEPGLHLNYERAKDMKCLHKRFDDFQGVEKLGERVDALMARVKEASANSIWRLRKSKTFY